MRKRGYIRKTNTKYDLNETMKILGQQDTITILQKNEQIETQIQDIMSANKIDFLSLFNVIDLFTLGFIYGKREERKKRNA